MEDCVFCKISRKEIKVEIVYEDDFVISFPDAHPLTPIHILIIPKRHIASVNDFSDMDVEEAGKMIVAAGKIAKKSFFSMRDGEKSVAETGYKLLLRTGKYGGQEIEHVHMHLFGGGRLRENIQVF